MGCVGLGERRVGEACPCHVAAGSRGGFAPPPRQQYLGAAALAARGHVWPPRAQIRQGFSLALQPSSLARWAAPHLSGAEALPDGGSCAEMRSQNQPGCLTEKQTCRDEVPTANGDAFVMSQPSP